MFSSNYFHPLIGKQYEQHELDDGLVQGDSVSRLLDSALDAGGGLLRLTPTWVPRSFLHPGRRIKLHPSDYYRFGADRGGIDERWFGSTTEAANENRVWHEGLSFCLFEGQKFLLRDAVAERGSDLVGQNIFNKYNRWPVYSKFFDNMGPIPHHMHQSFEDAKLVGQEGKPESYYFPPQLNNVDNNFAYTFMGLEPGTEKSDVRRCLENWNAGDNGILDLSREYRLQRGTGWLIPPGVLHAPGSLCTYEPQWGSDVFGMYQSIVEGRYVPWSLLVKDMPEEKHHDSNSSLANSIGIKTSTRTSNRAIIWNLSSTPIAAAMVTKTNGSCTAPSTASSCSVLRN